MVLSGVPWKKSPVTPPGIDPGPVRLVAQRLNHYATLSDITAMKITNPQKTVTFALEQATKPIEGAAV